MNMEIFRLINNMAGKNETLDHVMLFFSKDMIYVFAGILGLMFFLGIYRQDKKMRISAVNTAVFTGFNLIFAFFIGTIFYVDRPFVHHKVNLLYPHVEDASFPSDHATLTMSIALGIAGYNKLYGVALTLLSLVIGFSRIYVGHHSPFDIIGSYLIVFAAGYLYRRLLSHRVSTIYEKIENMLIMKLNR